MINRQTTRQIVERGLARRKRKEFVFRVSGMLATAVGIAFLGVLFFTLFQSGFSAFQQSYIKLELQFDERVLVPDGQTDLNFADFDAVARNALQRQFPDISSRNDRRELNRLLSVGAAYKAREMISANPDLLGETVTAWVPAAASVDMLIKGRIDRQLDETLRPLSDRQIAWVDQLVENGVIKKRFNSALFSNGDSREPELAGIRGAFMGSLYMLLVTLVLSLPIGAAAAIYLEELAPRNRLADLIEVNINNLAAVPSIVFGLLGLAIFVNWMSLPRSAPLVGGLVLTLLTLPVIIIASRAAIRAVSPSIREAALGLGASQMQVVFHHVLPSAFPGMLTGTIIGMSRALGESAPLLMIGMVAFIVDVPTSLSDPATALPVQIYLWADSPEPAFAERTSAAIIVLLGFLMVMNLLAALIRRRLEKR